MTAAAFRVDVESFNRPPWTEPEREELRAWMKANGIDPDNTVAITLGEGFVVAERYVPADATPPYVSSVRHPVRTLPPVWHAPRPGFVPREQ